MKEKKTKNKNETDIFIDTKPKLLIYVELFLLFLFSSSNNYIIRNKKLEIIEKLEIPEKQIAYFGIVLQSGRVIGTILIIAIALIFKTFYNMQYATFFAILFKSLFFLIYFDLEKIHIAFIWISVFFQGLCHSLIELYFHIWVNHFMVYKLPFLSFSILASPLSNIFGYYISQCGSISCCSLKSFKFISILDLIFLVTVCKSDKYFNLLYSKKENLDEYELNDGRIEELKKKMNISSIFCSENKYAFISIVLARAILKFSFVGIYSLIKKYYDTLDGEGEFIEFLIYYFPSIGLIIGAILSCFNWFKENKIILYISIFIGISGTFTIWLNNKIYFEFSIIIFYVLANIIIPSLIQKSFDCFQDEKLHEISYAFNCFFYLLIGNLLSFILNAIFQSETEALMKIYMLITWVNVFLIFNYNYLMKRNSHASQDNNGKSLLELREMENNN